MSYVPYVWSGETLISARNLRHADEQYEEAKDYLDAFQSLSGFFRPCNGTPGLVISRYKTF